MKLIAKKISLESEEIFSGQKINWVMEKNDKNKKVDLYIYSMGNNASKINIAIEFKIGYSRSHWKKDVEKLSNIQECDNLHRLFCLLTADSKIFKKLKSSLKKKILKKLWSTLPKSLMRIKNKRRIFFYSLICNKYNLKLLFFLLAYHCYYAKKG